MSKNELEGKTGNEEAQNIGVGDEGTESASDYTDSAAGLTNAHL